MANYKDPISHNGEVGFFCFKVGDLLLKLSEMLQYANVGV